MVKELEEGEFSEFTFWVLITGLVGGFFTTLYLAHKTLIPTWVMLLVLLAAGTLAVAVHYLFLRKLNRHLLEVLLYTYLGWGFIVLAGFLAVNYLFRSPEEQVEHYVVTGVKEYPLMFAYPDLAYSPYEEYTYVLARDLSNAQYLPQAEEVALHFQKGLLGYRVLDEMVFYANGEPLPPN